MLAEPTPRGARVMALTTGTLGLLAVGLLMVTITPDRADSPIALIASTTPVAVQRALRPAALAPAATDRLGFRSEPTGSLATPIGDGRFALVTRASLTETDGMVIDVRLPSGRTTAGSIVTASDGAVVVALAATEKGHRIAARRPLRTDIVVVMVDPPISVEYSEIDTVDAAEGTAVLDSDGSLVGLCSRRIGSDHVWLIEVPAELDAATSVVPAASR